MMLILSHTTTSYTFHDRHCPILSSCCRNFCTIFPWKMLLLLWLRSFVVIVFYEADIEVRIEPNFATGTS